MTPREAFIKATRKVVEACPCKFDEEGGCRYRGGKICACVLTMGRKCGWPGHAAILAQVKAFVDHECEDKKHLTTGHIYCRAALRKECGIE